MVDSMTPSEGNGVASVPETKPGLAGFLGTRNGRLIAGGLVLVLVLLAVGAVVYVFILSPAQDDLATAPVPPAGSVSASGSAEVTKAVPVYRRTKPLSSTFVFRDIFVPTVKAVVESTATTGGSGTGSGSGSGTATEAANVPANTLKLLSVTNENGAPMATFVWNGQTYTVGEGSQIGDTPWRVVSIEGNTVTLLYGDSRTTLTVGQGVSK